MLVSATKFGVATVQMRLLDASTASSPAGGTRAMRARGATVLTLGADVIDARRARKVILLALRVDIGVGVALKDVLAEVSWPLRHGGLPRRGAERAL